MSTSAIKQKVADGLMINPDNMEKIAYQNMINERIRELNIERIFKF